MQYSKTKMARIRSVAGLLGWALVILPTAGLAEYGMPITLGGYSNRTDTLTNFPVLVVFSNNVGNSGFSFSTQPFLSPNGYDLRFQDASGAPLNYEIELWNTNAASYVWVQVPAISNNGSSYIWAKWGNAGNNSQFPCTTNGATWTNGYVGVWHLDETNGTIAFNSTAYGATLNGTVSNLFLGTNGVVGNADNWTNGTGQMIWVPYNADLQGPTQMTASVWFNTRTSGGSNGGRFIEWNNGNPYHLKCNGGALNLGINGTTVTATNTRPNNAWTLATLTYNAGDTRYYQNGALAFTTSIGTSFTAQPTYQFRMGNWSGGDRALDGMLDEVRVSKATRSADWVWAEYLDIVSNTTFNTYGVSALLGSPQFGGTTVTGVTALAAWFNVSLLSTGAAATHVFALWGSTNAGAAWGGWAYTNDLGTAMATGLLTTAVTGLTGTSTYYYVFVATNPAGTVWSGPASFTTYPDWRPWRRKMRIPFAGFNNGSTLTNFPALVVLGTNLANFAYNQFTSTNGWDLRFTDGAESTNLNYEIERWSTAASSLVWVQVPLIRTNTDFIWAYWGNPAATNQPVFTTNGATWSAGFAGVWHLAQTNALDSTVNGNNGTASGNTNVAGIADGAQGFANAQEVNCGQGASLNVTTNLTLSAWIKPSAIDTWDVFVGKGDDQDYELEFPTANSIRMRVHGNGGAAPQTTSTVAAGSWYYAAGTYDGQLLRIYLNGRQEDVRTNAMSWTPGVNNLTLGHRTLNGGYYYSGIIDEVRVESVPRPADWIAACYQTVASNAVFTPYEAVTHVPVMTLPASAVGSYSATLNGFVTSTNGVVTTARFYWTTNAGQTNAYSGWDGSCELSGVGTGSVSGAATGLKGGTIYYAQFYATNALGEWWGDQVSFTTLPDWRGWQHRMKIPFSGFNNATPLTNFPALVILKTSLAGFAYSQFASSNGSDLRFSDSAESRVLNYEVENWSTNAGSYVWVQVPLIQTNTDFIWAYWGNPAATNPPAYTTNGATWSAGFVGVWHLNDTPADGAAIEDSTTVNGGTFHALNGMASYSTNGMAGGGLKFGGGTSSNYVQIANPANFNLGSNITVSTWFKGLPSNYQPWVSKNGENVAGWQLRKPGSSTVQWKTIGAAVSEYSGANSIGDGNWHQVTGLLGRGRREIYVDGTLDVGEANNSTITAGAAPVGLGARYDDGAAAWMEFYGGIMDEVRVESVPRSADWIAACYQTVASNATFSPYAAAVNYPVQTLPATNVQAVSAWLNGSLASTGDAPTTVRFYWTTNAALVNAYSGWDGFVELSGVSTGALTAQATGLLGLTTYFFQCYATNAAGDWWGSQASFTTLVAAVVDNNSGATGITHNAATLTGNLTTTNVAPTRVFALWGPVNAGLGWGGWAYTNDLGTSAVGPLSTVASGLTPTSTYYYVLVATNAAGTVWAPSTQSFATRLDMTAFGARMPITFPGYTLGENLTNFPALVTFGPALTNGFSYVQFASTNGWDLRFTSGDGTVPLNYEIEKWNPASNSCVWVQVPQFTNGATIWAYWGNASLALAPAPCTTNGSVWESRYRGVWHLSESTGTNIYDSTTNRLNGGKASATMPAGIAGVVAGGQNFTGSPATIGIFDSPALNVGSNFTVLLYLNGTGTAGNRILSRKAAWNGTDGWELNANGGDSVEIIGSSGGHWNPAGIMSAWSSWNQLAIQITNTTCTIYRDGIYRASNTGTIAAPVDVSRNLWLGSQNQAGNYFSGSLDEVRLVSGTLSSNYLWAAWLNTASNGLFNALGTVSSPVINNGPAANITAAAATLNGSLSATGGLPTHVYAFWGPTDGGMTATAWANTNDLGLQATGAVSTAISGLSQTSTYSYTFYATNAAGWCWAPSSTVFTTLVAGAIDNGTGATNISATAATLTGTLSATNASADHVFVLWGPANAGLAWAGWAHTNDLGNLGIGPFTTPVSSLTPAATYYYICVATNPAGAFWAASVTSFATSVSTTIDNDGGASNVTIVSATLNGNLTYTGAAPNHVYAFWGPTDGGQVWGGWACTNDLGQRDVGPIAADVSGLSPQTTYYYTYLATNPAGAAWAPASASFITHFDSRTFKWRTRFTFNAYTKNEVLTNFPALVVLGPTVSSGFDYGTFASTNGWDLRFVSSDLTQTLNYEVEKWDPSSNSTVWVQVPALSSNAVVWAYWGNPAAASQPASYSTNGATWSAGSLAVWHMKNPTLPLTDSTSNGNACASGAGPTFAAAGEIAGAQNFNGSQYVTNQTGPLNLGGHFTVSAWVNVATNSAVASQTILSTRNSGTDSGISFYVNTWPSSDQRLVFEGSNKISTASSNLVSFGAWHHVAAVINGAGGTGALYVDGTSYALTGTGVGDIDSNRTVYLGCFANKNALSYYKGVLDEIRIDTVERSSNWIWACWMNEGSNSVFGSAGATESIAPRGAIFTFR